MNAVPFDELYRDELFKQPIDWSVDYAAVRAGTLWPHFARGHDWAYERPATPYARRLSTQVGRVVRGRW